MAGDGAEGLVDRSGDIKSRLDLWPNPSSGLDVVDETHEGVAMDQNGNLYVDSEDGAGPIPDFQRQAIFRSLKLSLLIWSSGE